MQSAKLLSLINETLDDLKAIDITDLDVTGLTSITDYMVICTGRSSRQVQALADNLVQKLKEHDLKPINIDGKRGSEWILVDYADVIVHIMQPEIRDYYNLEKLWALPEVSEQKA